MSCRLPGCNYSTTSQIPAEMEHSFHWHMLDHHFKTAHPPKEASVSDQNAAPTGVKLSKSAKKRRRKRNSSNQTKVFDNDQDTAPMEVSQSDSVDLVDDVGVCLHGMVKLMCRGEVVRLFCLRCTERSDTPDNCESELAIKPDNVSMSVASFDDDRILATTIERCKCNEDPAVGNTAARQHYLGEAQGPDIENTRIIEDEPDENGSTRSSGVTSVTVPPGNHHTDDIPETMSATM